MSSLVASIVCLLIVTGCETKPANESRTSKLPFYNDPAFTPRWFEDTPPQGFHKIPDFNLVNQEGDAINQESFAGKIYVADFFFTGCPGICPKMTKNMGLLQEVFREDPEVMLISHSVTPLYDSIPILKKYATEKGVLSNKWYLTTGDREHIYNLGRNYYFVEEDLGIDKNSDDFLHTENFVLIDKNNYIRGIYNGLNKTAIKQLVADINLLKEG